VGNAYTDSKYVTARKTHTCGVCRASIGAGTRYLAWRAAINRTTPVCERDSIRVKENTDEPVWRCHVVEERIRAIGITAAATLVVP
jgi:hypothetical protein